MNAAFKQRMAGAIFILSLGVILIPVILEKPVDHPAPHYSEKPVSPGLPKTGEVAKINYFFNEVAQNFEEQSTQLASAEPAVTPEPNVGAERSSARGSNDVRPLQAAAEHEPDTPALDPGDWTIQLGAFSSRENADGLLAKLSEEGFQSYLKENPERGLVRVYVARGIEHDDAEDLLSELNQEMGLKGIIVRFRE